MRKQFRPQWLIGPLTRRVIALLLLVILLPSLALSVYIYKSISLSYANQLLADRRLMIQQTVSQIDARLLFIQSHCKHVAENTLLINLLRKGNLVEYPVYTQHYVADILSIMRRSFDDQIVTYRDICIYSDVIGLPEGSVFYRESDLAALGFWQERQLVTGMTNLIVLDREGAARYYAAKDGSAPRVNNLALLIYVVYDHAHDKSLGLLVMELTPNNLFSRAFDSSIQCLLLPDGSYTCGTLPAGFSSGEILGASGDIVQSSDHTHALTRSERFGYLLVDSQGVLTRQHLLRGMSFALLTLTVAVLIMLGFLALIRNFLARINGSISAMDGIIENRFQGRIEDVRPDELGQIDRRFNRMLDEIATQADLLLSEAEAKKAAQYEALRQQMNPHFIYNTLNLFSGAAQQSHQTALGDAIAFFGHLLHYNLKDTGNYALLREELNNAQSLIEIYALDEEKRLSLEIDVPEELQGLRLMKYLIQPLVENCISHGLRGGKALNIRIQGRLERDRLVLEVEDDGCGIPRARLEQIDDVLSGRIDVREEAAPGHLFIGLRNIQKRLRLFYGEAASLRIESEQGLYTRVRIVIPADLFPPNERLQGR